jgi:hypothetical protein
VTHRIVLGGGLMELINSVGFAGYLIWDIIYVRWAEILSSGMQVIINQAARICVGREAF